MIVPWVPPANRPDPLAILAAQAASRLPELLPLRIARMKASPFAFLRGAAGVMASDLAAQNQQALYVQLCGDAHLANFGAYASPEGRPVFDVNDFDETHPGPFTWDVLRLATSLVLAGQENGLAAKECVHLAARAARHYRRHMTYLATLSPIEAWHSTIDLAAIIADIDGHKRRRRLEKRLAATLAASQEHYGLVETESGAPRIAEHGATQRIAAYDPTIRAAFAAYPATLQAQYLDLLSRYTLADTAFKVVGIGSVGTFCAIGLFVSGGGAPLLLQLKEAQISVLAACTNGHVEANQGARVVTGQRRLQAQSDIFLGWTPASIDHRDFYVRRLKDTRLAAIGSKIEAQDLAFTAALCGRTLARAHGRAGGAAPIAAAMSDDFEHEAAHFAIGYAEQTVQDHALFCVRAPL